MTDRELLEMAAKAAGYVIEYWPQEDYAVVRDGDNHVGWCPLKFASDALRLAVKLELLVDTHGLHVRVGLPYGVGLAVEPKGDDAHAATCRAIVRAAAEIGRAQA